MIRPLNWFHRLAGLLAMLIVAAAGVLAPTTIAQAADDFLEPEQAFPLEVRAAGPAEVLLTFRTVQGYYLYREKFHFTAAGATLADPVMPAGHVKFDENFQKNVETYHGALEVRLPVSQASAGGFTLDVVSQGCADAGLCYPPLTRQVRVSLAGFGGDGTASLIGAPEASAAQGPGTSGGGLLKSATGAGPAPQASESALPTTPPVETDGTQRALEAGSFFTVIGAFWLAGLVLSLTPCVFPMVPILSSILTGGEVTTRRRGLSLAFAYSLGVAVIYTGFGIAAASAGSGLAAFLQKPLVLAGFAIALVLFSLSMFDVYELQLPTALTSRLDGASRKLQGGVYSGVFLMGGISALIVSPCVTAPLAGALLFISRTGDVILGGSALFALAMGMSTPLLVLGASAGAWMPRSGAWMHAVKRFCGLVLLAVALWIVQPVLPSPLALALWGALLLVGGFMLRPFDASPHSAAPRVWLQRAAGLAALAWGVMLMAGAASGGRDPLQPLAHLAFAAPGGNAAATQEGLPFVKVGSVAELDQHLKKAGRPVMLDFYADWCVSCKEMERFTFSDPKIQARLSKALLLKADVTANSEDDRALLKRFELFGPPGTIFFDAAGRESRDVRVIGFQNTSKFAKSLDAAGL